MYFPSLKRPLRIEPLAKKTPKDLKGAYDIMPSEKEFFKIFYKKLGLDHHHRHYVKIEGNEDENDNVS